MSERPGAPRRIETAHGAVVLVELPDDEQVGRALAALPAAEQAHAARLAEVRRREFIAGRTALRAALAERGAEAGAAALAAPILADDRGAPRLPAGWIGSVSHKGALAAAVVAPAGDGWIGLDLERAVAPRIDISRRVLTPREQARLADLGRPVTLRFAIKEAIYKAVDPHLRRYVAFTEVELELDDAADLAGVAGSASCAVTHALPLSIEAAWLEHAGHWLATARARPR